MRHGRCMAHRMRCRTLLLLVGTVLFTSACNTSNSPSSPSPATLNLTGTWTGNLSLMGTSARMTWTLTQTGTSVTGPVLVALPTGVVLMNGSLTGTLSGSSLPYNITIG